MVDCGNKKNMINERTCIDILNEDYNPLNENLYYSKQLGEHDIVVLYEICIMMDQPGKQSHANFTGGNSKFGG